MQFKTALLSLFVALTTAQSIDQIVAQFPACAKPCLDSASKSAGCDVNDHKCQCSKIDDITSDSVLCLAQQCSSDELQTASKVSGELCVAVAGQSGGDEISSIVQSITSKVGGAITSATGAAGGAFTSATGAAGGAFTSATGALGSAFTSATDAAGGLTIQTSIPTPTATPSPKPSGGAGHAGAGLGMVGAAAMFALAL
ncbi:hypothetical protein F5Y17DRAFT_428461 [Xylariaceae sp. FL0594]|nr:hypothetical protein F5Y17DRAFT_428461 [Xylariaceae sp. FL0594]